MAQYDEDSHIGQYRILQKLSEGGQGLTFLVSDESNSVDGSPDQAICVLKLIKKNDKTNRLANEVEAGLTLDHPNVLKIFDYSLESDEPYIVSEYCSGGALSKQAMGSLTILQCLHIFIGICLGVGHAHTKGIVHRDLKPDNIFLQEDGTPVVGDFGICFLTERGERFTLFGEIVGSRHYTAPELEFGRVEHVYPVSDVYSLGTILFWMVTGRDCPREDYRKLGLPEADLSSDALLMYELLDKVIVHDPDKRIADANALVKEVTLLQERVRLNAHSIGIDIRQDCNYCGIGTYELRTNTDINATSPQNAFAELERSGFGFKNISNSHWLVFVCDYCGNVQVFRPDLAKDRNIWKK